jgi:hypothetical protein
MARWVYAFESGERCIPILQLYRMAKFVVFVLLVCILPLQNVDFDEAKVLILSEHVFKTTL